MSVCPLRAVALGLALAAAPGAAQGHPEDRAYSRTPPGSVIERLGAFMDTLAADGPAPLHVGVQTNPFTDPDALRAYVYVIRPDSTMWIRTPEGESVVLDPYVALQLGERAGVESGYTDVEAEGVGYGFEKGRVFLYANQGVSMVVLALVLLALVALIGWLSFELVRSRRREAEVTESRRRFAEAREQERLRIAREIHDSPVQDLHALRLRLSAAGLGMDAGDVGADVLDVINGLRAISEDLRPPGLETMGLGAAVASFIVRFQRSHPAIDVDFDAVGDAVDLPEATRLVLFRVVQESMNNAARHGAPSRITVRTVSDAHDVQVSVEDNGQGFDVPDNLHHLGARGRYGLMGMAERVESAGGQLSVRRSDAGGVCVRARVPHRPVARRYKWTSKWGGVDHRPRKPAL